MKFMAEQFDLFNPPQQKRDAFSIYTDGGCWPNPGPGAWCAIVLKAGAHKTSEQWDDENIFSHPHFITALSGYLRDTTNNRAELTAIIRALKYTHAGASIDLVTDSQYAQQGCSLWLNKWRRHKFKTRDGAEVKNGDLWREIYTLKSERDCRFIWVRGHVGNKWNEACDKIATRCLQQQSAFEHVDELTSADALWQALSSPSRSSSQTNSASKCRS